MEDIKELSFDGTDWTELADFFGIEHPDCDEGNLDKEPEPLKNFLNETIKDLVFNEGEISEISKKVVFACRSYLRAFIESSKPYTYGSELFEGLEKVEHEETFMKFFTQLFPSMWV